MNERSNKEEIIKEFCVSTGEMPGVGIFKATRGFYIKTKDGPLTLVPANSLVELSSETARSEFSIARVIPYDPKIPEKARYRVVYPFRTVIDGLYVNLKQHDEIELSITEALPLLRENKIIIILEETKNES